MPTSLSSTLFRRLLRHITPAYHGVRRRICRSSMAKSKFEYVRQFETEDRCLPNCWIVVRIDGKGFHKFSDAHEFVKPNDERGLRLMSRSAESVMTEFKDVVLAYGQSDEYSFVFRKNTNTYNRRASKLMTNVVSLFASAYVMRWSEHFPGKPLLYPPAFDARAVLYPSNQNLRDYLSWRQADCHINNMYNTIFWKLVQEANLTPHQAQEKLKGTLSADKHEMMFTDFNTNYNDLPELYRKGTVLVKEKVTTESTITIPAKGNSEDTPSQPEEKEPATNCDKAIREGEQQPQQQPQQQKTVTKTCTKIQHLHVDIIGKEFWKQRPHLLGEER